jgi:hypothetical protein
MWGWQETSNEGPLMAFKTKAEYDFELEVLVYYNFQSN